MAEEDANTEEALKAEDGGGGSTEALKAEDDVEEVIEAVYGVAIDVTAVLGTSIMPISQVLKLGRGAVVELERLVGEEIELFAEENLIAKGEVVVIDDQLAVNITKIVKRL
jgi:flagellar motor switch protein FliN/FliY